MNTRIPSLLTTLMVFLSFASQAQEEDRVHGESHEHDVLEEVRVTATPLAKDALEMTQSASVLSETALDRELGNSLGDTLKNLPGVSNSSFGGNIGRPVIRGLDSSRVGVMENNMASNDVSKVSQDHAVSIEPFLADQIEVLRGPATLLYGSDTIGGVVNVRTNRIPVDQIENSKGRALIQFDTVAKQKYVAGRLNWAAGEFGEWVFHADAFFRRTDDYEIPGYAETDPEPGEPLPGSLFNSALNNEGGAIGGSWFGEKWRTGVSYSEYNSDYGIPGEHHHEDSDAEEVAEFVTIDMSSNRLDVEAEADTPFGGFENFKLLLNTSAYEHTEFEDTEVGTVFENDTVEGRAELTHNQVGDWHGVIGAQFTDQDFSALGEEAFVPASGTQTLGLFILEEADFDFFRLDIGARVEDIDTRVADGRQSSHFLFSVSGGVLWHLTENTHVALNLAKAERAPGDQELFAFGQHLATQTFEIGNPNLAEETSRSFEASIRKHVGKLTGAITVYRNDFDNFIFLGETGLTEDELPVRLWTQQDAEFKGFEVELRYDIGKSEHGHFQVYALADSVSSKLANGTNLPRQPPSKTGLGLEWDNGPWVADISLIKVSSQQDLAEFETNTSSYKDLSADISYRHSGDSGFDWEWFLKASNLLDEEIRNHASFLKDHAPHPGRNFTFGARLFFN